MNDFLQFLNTAGIESLTMTPGISPSLAENLIAARPFASIEDCLKVRGMGKSLLARAQASFEKAEAGMITEERALMPVEQEAPEHVQIEKATSAKEDALPPSENKPSFGARLGQAFMWFFRALLRLILIVLIIGGVGAAIYYGAPLINERFVAPVEQNAARVRELETEVASLQTQLTEIKNQLAEVNGQLSNQSNETGERLDDLEQSLEAHTASLKKLDEMQVMLEDRLRQTNDQTLLALDREVKLTRALDVLARARLYLAQSNFGLAKEDVQSARDLLADLEAGAQDEALVQAVERLDRALGNLPDFPVVASGDLEIAWQILLTGEPVAADTPVPTLTTTTATPEATPETPPSATPTP